MIFGISPTFPAAYTPIILGFFGLDGWLVNQTLFMAGGAAILLPIIIHLLNRRRFKVVDWAAMDFLLDADKRNRRRVRLENLLLLLLRCLAMLLIGLLLGRPFLPTSVTAGLVNATQFERIILLDDSLSMQTRLGNNSIWEIARKSVVDMNRAMAEDTRSDNSLTLLLMSNPDQPIFSSAHLRPESVDEVNAAIEKMEATDNVANLGASLQRLEQYLASLPANVNRTVHILTDLRHRDWTEGETAEGAPLPTLARLSKQTAACQVIDAGDADDRNLAITAVRPYGTLVQGVSSRFDISVTNFSSREAKDVKVKFSSGDALPLQTEIDRIGPGETANATFNVAFAPDEETPQGAATDVIPPRRVKIEVLTASSGEEDRLPADSQFFYAARPVKGIPTLLVDGDPSATFGKSESFYLRRSLSPLGPIPSGVEVDVITENELESASLDKYQVVFLCNVYRLGEKTAENVSRLEKWTQAGGGLLILPGDQVDEAQFNEHFFRQGDGLSPIRLEGIRGDDSETKWVNFKIDKPNHEVFKIFDGQNNPFLGSVKTFRWWGIGLKKEQLGTSLSIPARLTDTDETPAFVEKSFGKGRVLAATFPADADWSNWTSDPSYPITMLELVRYFSGDQSQVGMLRIGEALHHPLDITTYQPDAPLTGPAELKTNLQATSTESIASAPIPESAEKNVPVTTSSTVAPWRLEFKNTAKQGFYELTLNRREQGTERVLFAANVDPTEGNLRRVDTQQMKRDWGDANIELVSVADATGLVGRGLQTELWWYLLWILFLILACEQLLGWYLGWTRR